MEPSGQFQLRRLEIEREIRFKELEAQQRKEELEAQQQKEELALKHEREMRAPLLPNLIWVKTCDWYHLLMNQKLISTFNTLKEWLKL